MRIVMTGATSGIGLHAAGWLKSAATLTVGARQPKAVQNLFGSSVRALPLDLADLSSAEAFGEAAADGPLMEALIPRLAPDARVILTSSGTHDPALNTSIPPPVTADARRLAHPERAPDFDADPTIAGRRAYSSSKLCNVMTVREGAVRLADRLVLSLAGVGYRPPGYDALIPLTLSIGIAVFPDDGPGRLETLAAADARLGRVKTGGSGQGVLTDRLRANLPCSLADFSMLNALVTAVDAKDRYTRRHSEDVMTFSLQIAREMELDAATQDNLATAALLHDVGKIGVPDSVLRKPSALTPEEIEVIKHHPMMGSVIVAAVLGLEATLDAVRHHHERWDGLGYPFGLKGLEIPFDARLMAVADAFSAMTTDRPYRKGHPESEALGFLAEGSGTQWDPDCVTAFLSARRKLRGEPESPPLSSGIIAG